MTFSRKRSIDKKMAMQTSQQMFNSTNSSTKISLRPSSSRISSSRKLAYQQCLATLTQLQQQLENYAPESLDVKISENFRNLTDSNRAGVLISQKLVGYRQATTLMWKYRQIWKKNGKNLDQTNSALSLNSFRGIIEEISLITKQQRNDQLVLEGNITNAIFNILDSFVNDIESEATLNKQKKSLVMRKHSLKKVSQGSTTAVTGTLGRPKSRGKLGSLTKKDKTFVGGDLIDLKMNLKQDRPESRQSTTTMAHESMSLNEEIVFHLCCVVKNLSANKKIRRDLLKEEYIRLINRYLLIWNEKSISSFGTSIIVQLTSASRHLAAEEKSYRLFLKSNCFEPWTKLIQMFPTSNDLVFNLLRILSKLSAHQECCQKIHQKKAFLKTLTSFLKVYKAHIHIVIRVSFIFANMTSYLQEIRMQLYFDFNAWDDIFTCFEHYAKSQLKGKSEIDKMGISMAAWDYKAMKKESDIEALMKIIRLIANIFTVPDIGQHIYRQHSQQYRDLVKQLKMLLATKTNIQKYNELIACVLSCLTNILYYDKQSLMSNNEYKTIKKQLIEVLVDFVVQIDNEEVCCESLRVISNVTRMKHFIKPVLDAKIHEAILILLDSTSKQIVYYSLGIIINLLSDDDFKEQFRSILASSMINILKECQSEDFDIVTVTLKALSIVIEGKSSSLEPNQLSELENCLVSLGSHCDQAMLVKEAENSDVQSAQESRNLINLLLNNMPEQKFMCPVKNCGRKFADQSKLQEHVQRRHKLS